MILNQFMNSIYSIIIFIIIRYRFVSYQTNNPALNIISFLTTAKF